MFHCYRYRKEDERVPVIPGRTTMVSLISTKSNYSSILTMSTPLVLDIERWQSQNNEKSHIAKHNLSQIANIHKQSTHPHIQLTHDQNPGQDNLMQLHPDRNNTKRLTFSHTQQLINCNDLKTTLPESYYGLLKPLLADECEMATQMETICSRTTRTLIKNPPKTVSEETQTEKQEDIEEQKLTAVVTGIVRPFAQITKYDASIHSRILDDSVASSRLKKFTRSGHFMSETRTGDKGRSLFRCLILDDGNAESRWCSVVPSNKSTESFYNEYTNEYPHSGKSSFYDKIVKKVKRTLLVSNSSDHYQSKNDTRLKFRNCLKCFGSEKEGVFMSDVSSISGKELGELPAVTKAPMPESWKLSENLL